MFREFLAMACTHAAPSAMIRTAVNGKTALAECRNSQPDLIMLDLVLPDCDGLSLFKDIFAIVPDAKVIILSSRIDEFTLSRVLKLPVHAVVDKNEQPVGILGDVIKAVFAGRRFISPSVERLRLSLRADPAAFDKILSDREQEMLRLIGEGLTNEEIAARLAISANTARNHRVSIMTKLRIHSTPQLVRYAIEKGFTRIPDRPLGSVP